MPTQEQRRQATRNAILAAFRGSFLEVGVEATTTQKVLDQAGLSKGALYHHFRSKDEITEAIYREESHSALMRAFGSIPSDVPPVERLKRSCEAWLNEMSDPTVARIVLQIGPQALGLARVLEIENSLSLTLFEDVLAEAISAGDIALAKPALAARLINAMMTEIAGHRRKEREEAAKTIGPVVDAILESLGD